MRDDRSHHQEETCKCGVPRRRTRGRRAPGAAVPHVSVQPHTPVGVTMTPPPRREPGGESSSVTVARADIIKLFEKSDRRRIGTRSIGASSLCAERQCQKTRHPQLAGGTREIIAAYKCQLT